MIHRDELVTLKERAQDPRRDGSGLTFAIADHGGPHADGHPLRIVATDAAGHRSLYESQDLADPMERPRDAEGGAGANLIYQPFDYGGEYDDDMPQLVLVTDREARSTVYRATVMSSTHSTSKETK